MMTHKQPFFFRLPLAFSFLSLLLAGCASLGTAPAPTAERVNEIATAAVMTPTSPPEITATPFAPEPTATPTVAPSLTPTPDLSGCLAAGGTFEIGSPLEYSGMPEGLDYRVYLPPCYAEEPERRYPVLYLVHGQSSADDQWDQLGADEAANRLIAAGEAAPFLIVMPRDRVWLDPDGDRFGLALMDVLLPWIDAHYRTLPDRAHRSIGGLSRGAAWALHLGLTHWGSFGAFGLHSGVVFESDAAHIREWYEAIPQDSQPRIYLDDGEGDRYLYSMQALKGWLDQSQAVYQWTLQPGYHNADYWSAHVEEYLRWYTEPWKNVR